MSFNLSGISITKKNKTFHERTLFPGDQPVIVNVIFPTEMAEYFDIPSGTFMKRSGGKIKTLNQLRGWYRYKFYVETEKDDSAGSPITFTCGYSHKLPQKKIKEWVLDHWGNKHLLPQTIIRLQDGKIIKVVEGNNKTKKSKIYFVLCKEAQAVKIGVTNDVKKRLDSLQTANPFNLELLKFIEGNRSREQEIHKKFEHLKRNGEWFSYSQELREFINNL